MAHPLRTVAGLSLLLLAGCDYLFGSGPLLLPEPPFLPVEAGAVATTRFGDPLCARFHVDADGRMINLHGVVTPDSLPANLQLVAERHRESEEPDQPSLVRLEISPDRRAPWAATRALLWSAYHPDVRMYRVVFFALQETSRIHGAMFAELPRRIVHPDPYRLPPEFEFTEIQIRGNGAVDREALYAALLAAPNEPVVIRAKGDVPTGKVLRAYDVVLRAGRKTVLLAPDDPPGPGREPLLVNGRVPGRRAELPTLGGENIYLRPDHALPPLREEKR